jgi:hypothetical protein
MQVSGGFFRCWGSREWIENASRDDYRRHGLICLSLPHTYLLTKARVMDVAFYRF